MVIETSKLKVQSELCAAEDWFCHKAERLHLLAHAIPQRQIKESLKTHLPVRVERVLPRLQDPDDAQEWLSLILKTSFLIQLYDSAKNKVLVGLAVTGSSRLSSEQLPLIESSGFCQARRELSIAKHWFVVIPTYAPLRPSSDELLDALYEQLELEAECGIVSFK